MQIKGLGGKLLREGLYSNPLMYVNRDQKQGFRSHRVWTKMSFPTLSHFLFKPGNSPDIIWLENKAPVKQRCKEIKVQQIKSSSQTSERREQ